MKKSGLGFEIWNEDLEGSMWQVAC